MEIHARRNRILVIFAAALFAFAARLVPHPPNFAPVAGLALLSGAVLKRKRAAFVPLGVMLASDALIGFYDARLMAVVYAAFACIALGGRWLRGRMASTPLAFGAGGASIFFFLTTNFGVWIFSPWYAKTAAGLLQSYVNGLPFLEYTFAGDLFFTLAYFGAYALFSRWLGRAPCAQKFREYTNGARIYEYTN